MLADDAAASNTNVLRETRVARQHPRAMNDRKLTLFYAPKTRSLATRFLLEEIGAPYELHVVNFKSGENRQPAYLAINPMGKVPALLHGDAVVTEQVAIYIYLADLFASAGLAPPIDHPDRGPYLRWFAFYAACLEPATIDKSLKRDPAPISRSPYGTYDMVIETMRAALEKGPYLLGEKITAADLLWGIGFNWLTSWGLAPKLPEFTKYAERVTSRPAFAKVMAEEAQIVASMEA